LTERFRNRRVTLFLTALICAMFARQVQLGLAAHQSLTSIAFAPADDVLLRCGAAYTGMSLATEWPRLITSMFVHGGIIHLAVNTIALVQLGYLLEALFGAVALSASFWIGGIAAGGLAIAFPESAEGMVFVGASGAIFAIAGTLLVGLRKVTKAHAAVWSHRLSSRLVGCLAFNLILGLLVSAGAAWADLGFAIANTAHIAGLAAGVAIGFLLPLHLRDNELTRRLMRMFPERDGQP
jgi:rhomboid protease GluP